MMQHKHYICTDNNGRITAGWSAGVFPSRDTGDAILLHEGGYQFRLAVDGEENPPLTHFDGTHRYIYSPDTSPCWREATPEELAAELAEIAEGQPPPEPSAEDTVRLLRAQLKASTQRQDFLEDCIAEMAAQVYSV